MLTEFNGNMGELEVLKEVLKQLMAAEEVISNNF
jgi:hypothetical protein